MANRGFFVVLEGGEGSGKSTASRAVAAELAAAGREVVVTREPGGTEVAEAIRDLLLSDRLSSADPWCEALLFAAARADHVGRAIEPALRSGAVVVCDRFVDSSVAYQGAARGLGAAAVRQANAIALRGLRPDLTLVLDIDPAVGLRRAVGHNRMESQSLAFHRAVRAAFLEFAAQEPDRYLVIDAALPALEVGAQAVAAVMARLPQVRS